MWRFPFAPRQPRAALRKRVFDLILACVLLFLTLPLLLLALLLVKATSRGPAFYSQTRLGRNGRPFSIYKIRTMTTDAEKDGARWCLPGDSRVTAVGRWLRATHIDELPQLWNVLRGEMSLVGPRPERPEFVPQLEKAIPEYRFRLAVRPGITGLAQVQLPPDTDLDSVRRKLALDLYYIEHAGGWLDLRIGMATAWCMVGLPFALARWLFAFPILRQVQKIRDDASALQIGELDSPILGKPLSPALPSPWLVQAVLEDATCAAG